MTLAEAREWCATLATTHYENFTVAGRFLPADKREEYFALYAFARGADDRADMIGGRNGVIRNLDAVRVRRLTALEEWREKLDSLYRGEPPDHPVFIALEPVVHAHALEKELFDRLLAAFRMDQVRGRYETWADVRTYTVGSADPVGRLVLRLYGHRDRELDRMSDAICTGLQLVNFMQDVRDDYLTRDRIYLPMEELQRFNVSEEMFAERPTPEPLCKLLAFQAVRSERLFLRGRPLLYEVAPGLGRQLILFHGGGRTALDAMRRCGFSVSSGHVEVSKLQKLALVLRALTHRPL